MRGNVEEGRSIVEGTIRQALIMNVKVREVEDKDSHIITQSNHNDDAT